MCSLKSRRVPKPADHLAAIEAALVDVAENSYFSFVEPCDASRFREASDAQPEMRWLHASMSFSGAFGGSVEVALPETLARQMVQTFIGLAPGEPVDDAQMFDLAGELTNQVCGDWLTRSCWRRRFDLQPPVVVRMPEGWLPAIELRCDDRGEVLACVNDEPVCVQVAFVPQEAVA